MLMDVLRQAAQFQQKIPIFSCENRHHYFQIYESIASRSRFTTISGCKLPFQLITRNLRTFYLPSNKIFTFFAENCHKITLRLIALRRGELQTKRNKNKNKIHFKHPKTSTKKKFKSF